MANKNTFNKIWGSRVLWIIISLVVAFLLWVYVTMNETEDYEDTFQGVQVVFNGADALREAQGLIVTELRNTTVSVTLRGPRRVIASLRSTDIEAVVDLTTITMPSAYPSYSYTINYTKDVDENRIEVVRRNPNTVNFTVDRLISKWVEVEGQFNGKVAEGYIGDVGEMVFEPASIRISGPEEEVSKVAKALVVIDRDDVDSTIKVDLGYTLLNKDDESVELGNMTTDVEQINVTFPVRSVKTVPLTLDILHGAGTNDSNVRMECEPKEIQISGDADTLKSINRIVLGNLDMTDFLSTYEENYTINLPNDVLNESGINEAKVSVKLIGLTTKRFTVTNIVTKNVPEGYVADVTTKSIDVTIRAPESIIEQIDSSNLRAVLDLSEYEGNEGQYTVPAVVQVDGFTDAGAVRSYTALVHIQQED